MLVAMMVFVPGCAENVIAWVAIIVIAGYLFGFDNLGS